MRAIPNEISESGITPVYLEHLRRGNTPRMGLMNAEPIATFSDGSELLISTESGRDGRFACVLYRSKPSEAGVRGIQMVSSYHEGATCLEAQHQAYGQAQRLYPGLADTMRRPPYLIWKGPYLVS